jgi:peptide/nickel transport system substrate-binding protein
VNWNPLDTGAYATGTQGLIYEPLYLYDPIKNQYESWLATGAEASGWQGNKYVINVRSGVKWSDGQALTGADVAFSINLARTNSADPYSPNVATVANATASGNTVTVTFKGTPGYTEFTDFLWKAPILPQHIWSKIPASKVATTANTNPVGTGPMTLDTANTQELLQVQVPGGRGQRLQQPGTRPAELWQHRLVEQLPAGHQHARVRAGRQRRLLAQVLLLGQAVHAVRQHGVA